MEVGVAEGMHFTSRQMAGLGGLVLGIVFGQDLHALRAECAKADFEAVVGEAAMALRELNQANKPAFQARLKELKEKRGWSQDRFLKEAVPLVQDDHIAAFDERSSAFLDKIQSMGSEGANARDPSCAALIEVRAHMKALVGVQKDKWGYMFGRLEQELAK